MDLDQYLEKMNTNTNVIWIREGGATNLLILALKWGYLAFFWAKNTHFKQILTHKEHIFIEILLIVSSFYDFKF